MRTNEFLSRLRAGDPQTGLWLNLPGAAAAEIAADAGFEWLLIDQEHAPRPQSDLVAAMTAATLHGSHPIVRIGGHDPRELGAALDLGFHTVLVPMVETRAQAEMLSAACEFAPHGTRGVSSQTRAGAWGTDPDYIHTAREQICLIVQIESIEAVRNAEAILTTPGVDAVFIGTADLAATMGHLGDPGHADVRAAVAQVMTLAHALAVPLGTLAKGADGGRAAFSAGYSFVGLGTDTAMLAAAHRTLRSHFSDIARKANDD